MGAPVFDSSPDRPGLQRHEDSQLGHVDEEPTFHHGLPFDVLNGLGDFWTWTQPIVADGVEAPGCTATSEGLTF